MDIGAYNTCSHGCLYCYANHQEQTIARQIQLHDPKSPLLIGRLGVDDHVYERKISKSSATHGRQVLLDMDKLI